MNIQKGNELIAEFMGAKVIETYYNEKKEIDHYLYDFGGNKKEVYYPDDYTRYHASSMLRYHCSWDWLIPVCKKWNALDKKDISTSIAQDRYVDLCELLDIKVTYYQIEAVFDQIVQNLEWLKEYKETKELHETA